MISFLNVTGLEVNCTAASINKSESEHSMIDQSEHESVVARGHGKWTFILPKKGHFEWAITADWVHYIGNAFYGVNNTKVHAKADKMGDWVNKLPIRRFCKRFTALKVKLVNRK